MVKAVVGIPLCYSTLSIFGWVLESAGSDLRPFSPPSPLSRAFTFSLRPPYKKTGQD